MEHDQGRDTLCPHVSNLMNIVLDFPKFLTIELSIDHVQGRAAPQLQNQFPDPAAIWAFTIEYSRYLTPLPLPFLVLHYTPASISEPVFNRSLASLTGRNFSYSTVVVLKFADYCLQTYDDVLVSDLDDIRSHFICLG